MAELKTLSKILLLIFLYFVIYSFYLGILHPIPALGDSWDYHIPISESILSGDFLTLSHAKLPQWYYPGSSEGINSLFLLLHVPLTLSNLFAILILFFCLWKLAYTFKLSYYSSLLFALTFSTLNVVVRWANAVSIDMWVAVFFCLSVILLENPKKSLRYFLSLGFVFGMLVGSKYTACIFLVVLLFMYAKKLLPFLSFTKVVVFFIPFCIFGLSWYIRNYILVGNPFYPLLVFGFKGTELFGTSIIKIFVSHPVQMINAMFGEYKLWSLVLVVPLIYSYFSFRNKQIATQHFVKKLLFLGSINFLFFLQFPTSAQEWIMVSSFRYSYPIFIPLMLAVFLLAARYKREQLIAYIAIGSALPVITFAYYPKLVLIYIPLAFFLYWLLDKKK